MGKSTPCISYPLARHILLQQAAAYTKSHDLRPAAPDCQWNSVTGNCNVMGIAVPIYASQTLQDVTGGIITSGMRIWILRFP